MFTVRPPCKGCGRILRRLGGFARRVAGTASFIFAMITILFIVSTTLFLAACGAKGSGAVNVTNGASGDAKFESGTETGSDDATSVMLESARKMLNEDDGTEQTIEPVGRVEVGDTGDAAKELGCSLTLLTPEGAIAADAIDTVMTANDDGTIELILNANNASAFSSVNVEIRFDTENFNPAKWAVGAMFDAGARFPADFCAFGASDGAAYGIGEKGILALGSPGSTTGGTMYLGAAMRGADHLGIAVARLRPDLNGELSGSGELARVVFERKPYVNPAMDSRNTSADDYEPARTPEYFWDWDYGVVFPRGNYGNLEVGDEITRQLPGDADGDLEVTVADITSIATHYLKELNWYGGQFPYDPSLGNSAFSIEKNDYLPDLDKNGEIGIPDITEIVYSYGNDYSESQIVFKEAGGEWQSYESYGSIPFDMELYDYGLSYVDLNTGEMQALPLAEWFMKLFILDEYFDSIEYDPELKELAIRFELVGDEDHSGEVGVPDFTPFATNMPDIDNLTYESLIPLFTEKFHNDFIEMVIKPDFDDLIPANLKCFPIAIASGMILARNYKMNFSGLEISYYDSIDSETPILTDFRALNLASGSYNYDPDMLNWDMDVFYYTGSLFLLKTTLSKSSPPVYISLKIVIDRQEYDDVYSLYPERILIE